MWQDPEVRRLAERRAGDPDLAQDALMATVVAIARMGDLAHIKDLKAYCCRVLINEIYHLRGQLAAARPCDPVTLAVMSDARKSAPSAADEAVTRLIVRAWLGKLRARHARLRAAVPGRSREPGRYRDLIIGTAEHILGTALDGHVSWADGNETLQAALPDWFGRPGSAGNTAHQHLSRARRDVQDLLKAVISPDELQS
jgi:hypothetical protein